MAAACFFLFLENNPEDSCWNLSAFRKIFQKMLYFFKIGLCNFEKMG